MKIVYLKSAREDLEWMRKYYTRVFPEGASGARRSLKTAERILADNPEIGRNAMVSPLRQFLIARTPFSLIYRIRDQRIEILRVWDGRQDSDALNLD